MDKTEGKWNSFKNNYVNGVSYGGLIGVPAAFVKYIQELLKLNCKLITDDYKKCFLLKIIRAATKRQVCVYLGFEEN